MVLAFNKVTEKLEKQIHSNYDAKCVLAPPVFCWSTETHPCHCTWRGRGHLSEEIVIVKAIMTGRDLQAEPKVCSRVEVRMWYLLGSERFITSRVSSARVGD